MASTKISCLHFFAKTALSNEKKVTKNQLSLAYLLSFPFKVIPIIGPRTMRHLKDSHGATKIKLTCEERMFLTNGKNI